MTTTNTALQRLLMTTACGLVLLGSGQAAAQTDIGEIVVTGSRIPRAEQDSLAPLQALTAERIDQRGFTNLADALNDIPAMGVPVSPISDQGIFGAGRNFINLNNLGTNRTLVLVNGRRFVAGNPASIFSGASAGGQVDLNVLPTALIDRVEVIQAGGSAVYGSDAISGVVNVILKPRFDGVEIDGRYGWSDGYDDWRARITAGRSFADDRLSLMGSYEYSENAGLSFADRAAGNRSLSFAANPANRTASDNVPGSILIENRRLPEITLGGLPFRVAGGAIQPLTMLVGGVRVPAQFGPGGVLIPYNPGVGYQPSIASGGQGLDTAPLTTLVTPIKRHVATGFATYEVTDRIRARAELFYARAEATEPYNQPIFNAPLFSGTSAQLQISTSNPFLPAATRAAILAQPVPLTADPSSPGDVIFLLSRASPELGPNRTSSETQTVRALVGLEGDFELAGREGFWNLSFSQAQADGHFEQPNIIQSRFAQAVNVTRDGSGAIVCRDPAARAAGCVPLNLFGEGAPSQAAIAWIGTLFRSDFKLLQTIYQGNAGLDVAQLPAGPWRVAAGFEARYEKSDFNPNDAQERGLGRQAAISAISGKYDTREAYIETRVPLLGGDFAFPLAQALEIDAAYRVIDHSQSGSDRAWTYGGRWRPVRDLTFRAQKGRSFRAPAVTELYLPRSTAFISGTVDPCDFRNIGLGPAPATRRANCEAAFQAAGLPANFQLTGQATSVAGTAAGDPNLDNETARQWSAGVVYTPAQVPGLSLSFDWTDVRLTDAITSFSLSNILQACYDTPGGDADACSRFQRGGVGLLANRRGQVLQTGEVTATGPAAGPATGFVNAGYVDFEGFTAAARYGAQVEDLLGGALRNLWGGAPGRLDVDFQLTHVKRLATSITGYDLNTDQGEIGAPKWRWRTEVGYDRDPISLVWATTWIDRSRYNNDYVFETRYPLTVDDYMVHDIAGSIALDRFTGGTPLKGVKARFAVRNVFDVEPPYGSTTPDAGASAGTYDILGRYYQVGLTARF
jgi:outer membrane receptor protein involved in Fe transport